MKPQACVLPLEFAVPENPSDLTLEIRDNVFVADVKHLVR